MILPALVLHEQATQVVLRNVRQRVTTTVAAQERGMGKSFVLHEVCRRLAKEPSRKVVVLPVFNRRKKGSVLSQLYYSLYSPRVAISDVTEKFRGTGIEEAQVRAALEGLREYQFVFVVDDVQFLAVEAIQYLHELLTLPNTTLVASVGKSRREAVLELVGRANMAHVSIPAPSDRELRRLLDAIVSENKLPVGLFRKHRLLLVKASHGIVGRLVNAVERLARETSPERFREVVLDLVKESKVFVVWENVRVSAAILGMATALMIRLTTDSVFRTITAVAIGALSLAAYRVWLGQTRQDADMIGHA